MSKRGTTAIHPSHARAAPARRRLDADRRRYSGLSLIPLLLARRLVLSLGNANPIARGFEPPGPLAHRVLKMLKRVEMSLLSAPVCGTSVLAVAQVGNSR